MLRIHLKCINYLNMEGEIVLKVIVKDKYPNMPMPKKVLAGDINLYVLKKKKDK